MRLLPLMMFLLLLLLLLLLKLSWSRKMTCWWRRLRRTPKQSLEHWQASGFGLDLACSLLKLLLLLLSTVGHQHRPWLLMIAAAVYCRTLGGSSCSCLHLGCVNFGIFVFVSSV